MIWIGFPKASHIYDNTYGRRVFWVSACDPKDPGLIPRWAVCCFSPEQETSFTLLQPTQLYDGYQTLAWER